MTDDPTPPPSAPAQEPPPDDAGQARSPARSAAYAQKQDLVLKTAAALFFRQGYTRTRIADIARALGVTAPFVYYHFPSKLDLLTAICARTSVMSADLAEAALADPDADPVHRFRRFVREMSLRVIEEREFLSILFIEGKHLPPEVQARLRADRQRFARALHRLLDQGARAGVFRIQNRSVANQTVTGMITWLFNWYDPEGPETPDQLAARMETLVLAALGVPWERAAAPEMAALSDNPERVA